MTQLDERKLDPAVALAALDEAAPREPQRLFALKHEDSFIVADAYGDIRGDAATACSTTTPACCRASGCCLGGQAAIAARCVAVSQDNVAVHRQSDQPAVADRRRPVDARRASCTSSARASCGTTGCTSASRLSNYCRRERRRCRCGFEFAADFRDMFEVRGTAAQRSAGSRMRPTIGDDCVALPLRRPGQRRAPSR